MIEDNRYYWSHLKTRTTTVRVTAKKQQRGIIFRVRGMIDLGDGRQTVMLDNIDYPKLSRKPKRQDIYQDAPAVPFCMGNLDFIYLSREQPAFQNIRKVLSSLDKDEEVQRIVPEILAPKDLLIFRQESGSQDIKMVDVFRIVKEGAYKKYKDKKSNSAHAL